MKKKSLDAFHKKFNFAYTLLLLAQKKNKKVLFKY